VAKEKLKTSLALKRFISSGKLGPSDRSAVAEAFEVEVRRRTQRSMPGALRYAEKFLQRVEQGKRCGSMARSANRALARTLHLKGEYRLALKRYQRARALGGADVDFRARIDRALVDVYMYLEDFPSARKRAQMALAAFRKLKSELDVAMTMVNYANLFHRQDRHREAEKYYREASAIFKKQGNKFALARASFNRANCLLQLFDVDQAERLYQQALKTYTELNLPFDATEAKYSIGWLRMLTGQFHLALRDLNDARRAFRTVGHRRGVALCDLDMAESYLQLNLYSDALDAARLAESAFNRLGLRYEEAKAALFRAKSELLLGKNKHARRAVNRAMISFKALRNYGFLGAARLLSSQIEQSSTNSLREAKSAQECFERAELPLWEAICDLHLAASNTEAHSALHRLSKNKVMRSSPHLFAHWQTLLGDQQYSQGKFDRARDSWTRAAECLDSLRAQLPPIELRDGFTRRMVWPHLRLISSEANVNELSAAAWVERYRTSGVWAPVTEAREMLPPARNLL